MKNPLKKPTKAEPPVPATFTPLCATCKQPASVEYRRSWENRNIGVTYQFYCEADWKKVQARLQRLAGEGA